MDILHLIDRLEELVAEARRMPIGQGVVVDRRRVLEMVDQMRSTVPWEVKEAARISQEREEIIEEAQREGEAIIHRATLEAQERLDESVIIHMAEQQAQAILSDAEARSRRIIEDAQQQVQLRLQQAEQAATNQMDEADRYALEMLRRLDQQLAAFSNTIRSGVNALEERTGAQPTYANDDDYR